MQNKWHTVKKFNNTCWKETMEMAEDGASTSARVQRAPDIPNSLPLRAKTERVHKESAILWKLWWMLQEAGPC